MTDLLNFQSYGEGERAVIVCHGLYGQLSNLAPIARELASDYRVIAVDMRNHGRSFHSDEMNYPVMAQDILGVMNHLGIERAALVGHSMGGKAVMEAALIAPDRVQALIVADIAPVSYEPHHDAIFAALSAADDPAIDRAGAKQILEAAIDDDAVIGFLLMNRIRQEDGTWRWRFNLSALVNNYSRILGAPQTAGSYDGPTLFIKGELSTYILPAHEDSTRSLFPNARVRVIAGTGHWLHAEKPAVFLRLVRDALRDAMPEA